MELKEAILARHSTRGYLPTPVPQDVLKTVLELGTRAVSAQNTQPWKFAVVTGEVLDKIREANMADYDADTTPDYPDAELTPVQKDRARTIGKQLLTSMEIAREDRERRDWWMRRGFRFFDAPAVILIYMDSDLDETYYRMEMGTVAQTICFAAMTQGLGTCVENQAITWQAGINKYLDLPENARLAIGIAIGYPDPDFAANHVVTPREDVDNLTTWYGF
jgi:nitroreductase